MSRTRVRALSGALMCAVAAVAPAQPDAHRHPRPAVLAPGYAALEFEAPQPGSYELPPLGTAADATLLDSDGHGLRLHELLGDRVVVLSFIYTRCSDVNGCPLAGHVLKRVQDRLLAAPALADRVRLLSISFDPQYDTPEVLRDYAAHLRSPVFDWRFLTAGSEPAIDELLDAYGQGVIREHDADGRALGSISHLLRVYLVDRALRIRNIYTVSFLHPDTLEADIRTLLMESK